MRKTKNDEWIRLGEEMELNAKRMQRRFSSKVRHKGWETDTHIRGLDRELRSSVEALSKWEHFDTSSVLMLEVE